MERHDILVINQLIVIAEDDSSVALAEPGVPNVKAVSKVKKPRPKPEKTLVLGSNSSLPHILSELAQYAAPGSTATVDNPRGAVRLSSPFEYFYERSNVARFTADEPGTYKIQVSGELVFPDQVNASFPRQHSYVMTVTADGESAGGCAVAGGSAGGALGLLLLAGRLLLRRRR